MINENPLKQYFRRPSVYLRLPSNGKFYTSDTIDMPENGEIPVYPMTALDDITLKTPDALFNGIAIVDLIKSCVPNIKDPWKINNIDLDAILIAIRSASGESSLSLESTCPKCSDSSTYSVEMISILSQLKSADYDTELVINDLKFKLRPLDYKEMNDASLAQFNTQKLLNDINSISDENEKNDKLKNALQKITEVTMSILTNGIEYIATPTSRVSEKKFIYEFLKHCDKNDYNKIRDHLGELRKVSELKPLQIKCASCSHDYEQPFVLNATDFFA